MDNFYDLNNTNINDFIKAYRESLQAQRDSSMKQLAQQRKNAQVSLMGASNRKGTLFSNLNQRDKIKYDTETYMPGMVKVENSYRSGLDSLRDNAITLWNKIKTYAEQIADYNADIV